MFSGTGYIYLSEADMNEALQEYLNKRLLATSRVKVTDVYANYDNDETSPEGTPYRITLKGVR